LRSGAPAPPDGDSYAMSLTLGILQTGSVQPEFQPRFGDYPAMFEALLRRTAPAPAELGFRLWRCEAGEVPAAADADAYVITGSRHSVYDDLLWLPPLVQRVREILATQRPVVGICFGHQLLAHYFGGRVVRAPQGWGVGVQTAALVRRAEWMMPAADEVRLLASHQDQVTALPEGAELFAGSEFCPLAGYTVGDRVLTFQGHPEFNREYAAALLDSRRQLLGPEVYERAVASLAEPTNEEVVGRWIHSFIGRTLRRRAAA